jgi:hypothetical protein
MRYKFNKPLVTALVMLFVVSAVAVVAAQTEQTLTGTVDEVDARAGSITLRTAQGPVELQAPAALLSGWDTGEAVDVKIPVNKATPINKKGSMDKPMQRPMPQPRQ